VQAVGRYLYAVFLKVGKPKRNEKEETLLSYTVLK